MELMSMIPDLPLAPLSIALVVVVSLFIVVRNLMLPADFGKNEKRRSELRKKLLSSMQNERKLERPPEETAKAPSPESANQRVSK